MGRLEVAGDGEYGTFAQREANREAVDQMVADWTSRYDRAELLRLCEEGQVPCGPVYAIDEIFGDPQYAARENILRAHDERIGDLAIPNIVPRLTGTPGKVKWLGRGLGEHNKEIYGGLLGLSDERIDELTQKGVI